MILQALYDYYQRKADDPESGIAPYGWEWKEIPFIVVIDKEGNFIDLKDTRESEGNRKRAKSFLVPKGEKRTVNIQPFLLWDNVEYALGANPRNRKDIDERFNAFRNCFRSYCSSIESPEVSALEKFLNNNPSKLIEKNSNVNNKWNEAQENNSFVSFQLDGEVLTIPEKLKEHLDFSSDGTDGISLLSGKRVSVARLHPSLKGVRGTNTTGAAVVSFNLSAFTSYHKNQNNNAPIGEVEAFSYTTALNLLLSKDSQNKVSIGDTTTVFWAQKKPPADSFDMEREYRFFLDDPPKDDPDRGIQAVKGLYQSLKAGKIPHGEDDRFFVLGLSPNAARISVRYWKTGTVHEFAQRFKEHFDDLEIVKGPMDHEYLSLGRLLRSIVHDYKMDNVPPNLAGKLVESVLNGTPYPQTLLNLCINRIRAERHVTQVRAALLKAHINRFNRKHHHNEKEITVALDKENSNTGYRLGRLFAVLEAIQEKTHPGINATIRDRFYGAASTTPATVFSRLLSLKNHHLGKLESPGLKHWYEKSIGEIMDGIDDFPAHLALKDQARFAIGYYHQRQDFFTSKKHENEEKGEE